LWRALLEAKMMTPVFLFLVAANGASAMMCLQSPSPKQVWLSGAAPRAAAVFMTLEEGDRFPEDALGARLSVASGKRVALCFIERDDGFACAKAVQSFSERAAQFAERSCSIAVVRPTAGIVPKTALRFPAIRFLDDADGSLMRAAGLSEGGGPMRRSPRATYVLSDDGTVCGLVSDRVEATAHAQYALKLLGELDAAATKAEEAQRPSVDALKQMVAATTNAEVAAAEEQVTAQDERQKRRALRAQSLFAEANRNAKFSFGRTTLAEEAKRLGALAAQRAEKAADEEQKARLARTAAEAAGDTSGADRAREAAEVAARKASDAREDEAAALQIQVDAAKETLAQMVRQVGLDEQQAKDFARRAYSQRRLATAAMLQLDEAKEQAAMKAELENWAKQQAADKRVADGYRAAVEAVWAQSQPTAEIKDQAVRWADQLALIDPAEMPNPGSPTRDQFGSVVEASTFAAASRVVAAAEREEAAAKDWAERVKDEQAKVAEVQLEIDEMAASMQRKQSFEKQKTQQTSADDLRAAMELAMFKGRSADDANQ
jgi:peroxiredoxin